MRHQVTSFLLLCVATLCIIFAYAGLSGSVQSSHFNEMNTGNVVSSFPEESGYRQKDTTKSSGSLDETDVSQMFNERGYLKSNGISLDEQEIVSDYGGNLMYSIPLYSYTMPQAMKYEVKLAYNGSVGHSVTLGDTSNLDNGTATKYNLNSPEWIISVNDIAVQVFNFEFNYFSNPEGSSTTISGNGLHKIIPGYHYCDRMMAAGAGDNDRIMILAGDGSLITLVNTDDTTDIGDYVYEGRESYYKAKVTYFEDSGFKWYRNRRMELMKGDGNVFIFNEYKVEFEV